jgi:hypothetical protein
METMVLLAAVWVLAMLVSVVVWVREIAQDQE